MVINFDKIGGGGGGTSNYNDLTNKPQINGITLSGNKTSSDLGITPNELKAVENVPSAATNGSVFAEYREEEVGHYGWQYDSATGSTFVFDMTLNPFEVATGVTQVTLCHFTYDGSDRTVLLMNEYASDNRIIVIGVEEWQPGASGTVEPFTGVYLNFDYTDTEHPSFTFVDGNGDPVDVVISDEIEPHSETLIIKELKQAYNVTEQMSTNWAFWGGQTYQGKAENTELRMPTNFVMPSGETLVSHLEYYDIPINTYWDGTQFKVEYSLDSGTTWQWAFSATTFGGGDGPITVGPSEGQGKTCQLTYAWYYYGDINKNCFKLSSNKSISHPVVNNFTNDYNALYFDTFLKSGSSYNLLTDKPQINGVELTGDKSLSDLGITVNSLINPDNFPQTLTPTDGTDIAGKGGGFVIYGWDGKSDMTFSAEASRVAGNWGPSSFNTPYFSGGTWYGFSDMRGSEVKFVVLPGNVIYLYGRRQQQSWGQPVYQFTGNVSGSVGTLKMYYIDEVKQGSNAEVRIFRTPKVQHCGFSLADFRGDGTITFSANTGDVIALDIANNAITGATFNGDSFSEGQEMILKSGLDYFCYHGTQGYLVVCDGTYDYSGSEAYVDYFTDVDVPLNESDEPITDVYFTEKQVYDEGAYQWNGYLWDKLVNENELPAPAAGGGVQTHWVPYTDSQTYAMEGKCNYVRGDIVSDGDYYCSVGQIDGEQKALWATVSNGAITGVGGQLYSNEINGHYYITVKDSNENTYGAQCWVDNGKLYWQVYGTTIVHLDNNELGANWEAGFIY